MAKPPPIDSVIDLVLAGHTDCFQYLIRDFAPSVRGYIAAHVRGSDDIDDLLQDVFMAAYRGLPTFRRGDDFGAWLRGIAHNKVLNHLRSYARRMSAYERFRQEVAREIVDDLDELTALDNADTLIQLHNCIEKLPERLRRVVRATLQGVSPSVIANQFQTSTGAVYNLCYRANRLLRDCLGEGRTDAG
jgi:RNA polymerase sigma-70 factor (ECF subfamily)